MKKIILILLVIAAYGAAYAARPDYDVVATRAERSFQWEEWSSAAAMYELMLAERPDSLSTYAHAIVANQLIPDTVATVDLLERAMSHGIGLDDVLAAVRLTDYSIGRADLYAAYLLRLQRALPYIKRPLDNLLLNYYTFRHDGPMVEKYSLAMLEGLPESTHYLASLAHGYMLDNQEENAVATWQKILTLDPGDYDTLLRLGNYWLLHGNEAEGRLLLARAQAIHPTPFVEKEISTTPK